MPRWIIAIFALVVIPLPAAAATEIARHVFGSGGTGASAAHHQIQSTLGQPVVGAVAARWNTLRAGFWLPSTGVSALGGTRPTPAAFALSEASPNPFHAGTTLRYSVGAAGGPVRLRVFDVDGRLVRTLVDRTETPGPKALSWDGRNARGSSLPAGIYLLSMEAPGFRASRKLALQR